MKKNTKGLVRYQKDVPFIWQIFHSMFIDATNVCQNPKIFNVIQGVLHHKFIWYFKPNKMGHLTITLQDPFP